MATIPQRQQEQIPPSLQIISLKDLKHYKRRVYILLNHAKLYIAIKAYHKNHQADIRHRKRLTRFKDRKCRVCEIMLIDEQYGAKQTVYYCRSCRDKGLAQKHINKLKKQKFLCKQYLQDRNTKNIARYTIKGVRINLDNKI